MKQLFYATGMLALFALTDVKAQKNEVALVTKSSIMNSPLLKNNMSDLKLEAANVSAVVAARFARDFRNARDVEWREVKNGYRVYFLDDAVLNAVDYTKKGSLFSIIRYGKFVIPKNVSQLLFKHFDQPVIVEASEVKIADFKTIVYVVVLEDKTSLKTIQIIDNDFEVLHEMRK